MNFLKACVNYITIISGLQGFSIFREGNFLGMKRDLNKGAKGRVDSCGHPAGILSVSHMPSASHSSLRYKEDDTLTGLEWNPTSCKVLEPLCNSPCPKELLECMVALRFQNKVPF